MTEKQAEIVSAAAKQAPPWAIIALDQIAQIPLERWVLIATLVYTLLQIIVLVRGQFFRANVCTVQDDEAGA